jgi:pimeloyl-ACP methyl ester carboxylesterase
MSSTSPALPVVLIHGLWMTPLSWEHWVARFRALFQAGLANLNPRVASKVNFRNNDRAPLLIIGGGVDHVIPPRTSRTNFKLYHRSTALTEYKEFPGRSHYTLGQDGWEEVADYALDWTTSHARTQAAVGA